MILRNIKQLRIIRVLLDNPTGILTKYKIAKIVNCSIPRVIQVIQKLEKMNFVKVTKVIDFNKLIQYYIKIDNLKSEKYYYHIANPLDFFKKIKLNYAFTTYAAENIINHHLFLNKFDVYISKKDFTKWRQLLKDKALIGKGNLTFITPKDEDILKESVKIKGYNVVSTPQLLIDLKKEGGVCIEAYNILLDKYVQQKRN
jgi:DNA-binding Lrp family transcriptional regulator